MAEAEDAEGKAEGSEAENTKSGKRKKILLLAVLLLLIVGLSVGGTIAALRYFSDAETPPETEDAVGEEVASPPPSPAIYYPLKPEYIVNINARGKRRYLRLDIELLTRDNAVVTALETHRASVDHIITMVSGGQILEEIQTPEGKEFLRVQLLKELQALFEKEIGKPGIEQVLFTNFVMQ